MREFCPFCSSPEHTLYSDNQPYRDHPEKKIPFYTCSRCGTIYPGLRLDFDEIEKYIGNLEMQISINHIPDYFIPWYDFSTRVLIHLKRTNQIRCALDIGANNGKFCRQLEKAGIESKGIEPQKMLVDLAQKNGIQVFFGMFPDNIPGEILQSKYDLISMNEVIYYFPDLKQSLETANTLLSENGVLYIQSYIGENDNSRYHSSFFSRPGDYLQTFPSRTSFRYWLEKTGFDIIETIPVPDEYFSILTGISPTKGRPLQQIFNMLYGRLIQDREYWLNRVDRMVIIARKKHQN